MSVLRWYREELANIREELIATCPLPVEYTILDQEKKVPHVAGKTRAQWSEVEMGEAQSTSEAHIVLIGNPGSRGVS